MFKQENSENSNPVQTLIKIIKIFIGLSAVGSLGAYLYGIDDPIGAGLLLGLGFLIAIIAILKVSEKFKTLRWMAGYGGSYVGAVVIPLSNVYLAEEDPWGFLSDPQNIPVLVIVALVGAWVGCVIHILTTHTTPKRFIFGGVALVTITALVMSREEVALDVQLVYSMSMAFVIGGSLTGLVRLGRHWITEFLKEVAEEETSKGETPKEE